MKAGTQGYSEREESQRHAELARITALNDNKTALLQITVEELKTLYGEENVNTDHPLFGAILSGANGIIVNLEQLTADIEKFKTEVASNV